MDQLAIVSAAMPTGAIAQPAVYAAAEFPRDTADIVRVVEVEVAVEGRGLRRQRHRSRRCPPYGKRSVAQRLAEGADEGAHDQRPRRRNDYGLRGRSRRRRRQCKPDADRVAASLESVDREWIVQRYQIDTVDPR